MIKPNFLNTSCLLLIITCIFFSSCGTSSPQTLFNAATDVNAELIKDVYIVNDQGDGGSIYKIKVNDVIAINNLQNREWGGSKTQASGTTVTSATSENITTYRIDVDGTANLPAIGKVLLVGLTRREATVKLQERYGSTEYLKDPIIDLSVVNLKVTLFGEFSKQGNFLLTKENTHLIEIIGEAGGLTKDADPKTLKIIRGNPSNPTTIQVNLNNLKSIGNKNLILQNNDIIYIQQTKNAVLAERLQRSNNIIQPLLVVVNLAVLIFTLTK